MHDLFLDQVRYVMPGRTLPLPAMWESVRLPHLPFPLPAWWASPFPAAVALGPSGPFLGGVLMFRSRRLQIQHRLLLALVTALSLAVLPQMLGRTDIWHALYIVGPALVLAGALAQAPAIPQGWGFLVSACLLLLPVRGVLMPQYERAETETSDPRLRGIARLEADEADLVAFLNATLPARQPIYVGLTDHRRVFVSETGIYFLTNRPGATRIMQLEPKMADREDVQRKMAQEIGRRAGALVLSSRFINVAERRRAPPGSGYLDAYIREHFTLARSFGPYQVWLPRP